MSNKNNFINRIKEISLYISEKNVTAYAASAAFFMVLSIFPLLLLLCSMLPFTGVTLDGLFEYLQDVVPVYILELCKSMFVEYEGSKIAIISVTAILAVWASGKGAYALSTGVASINDNSSSENFIIARIKSSLYTVVFIILILFFIVVMILGNKINSFLMNNVPDYSYLYSVIIKFRFLFAWVLLTIVFQIMYALMPGSGRHFFKMFPGALFASIGWSLLSFGFSLYIDIFGSLSIYGDFVAVIFALLWLYWCMYIILLGAAVNYYYMHKNVN